MSNITNFTKHIASRKAKPIGIELKESKIEIPSLIFFVYKHSTNNINVNHNNHVKRVKKI